MAEYIKRETCLAEICNDLYARKYDGVCENCKIVALIVDMPTADVAPVVHGKWLEKEEETYCPVQYGEDAEPILHKYTRYICNLCGRSSVIPEPYCHCGAKMDGGANNG